MPGARGPARGMIADTRRHVVIRVKICCIASVEEARLAVRAGASAVGLVSAMPTGPGVIEEEAIARVASVVPPGVSTFLLTSRTEADAIAEQHARLGTQVIQLVDRVPPEEMVRLRRLAPSARLVPVVHVTGPDSEEEARVAGAHADAVLLDSGRPDAEVRELGGTGRTHDWEVSARIREMLDVPVFLAGGLTADNLARAVDRVRPFGLDVCSGVRTGGRLDREKLRDFMAAVRGAGAAGKPGRA